MAEANAAQGIDNTFYLYDDDARKNIENEETLQLLNKLEQRFGRVELSDLNDRGGFWCVRIHAAQSYDGDPLPLAALGRSLDDAAQRLWRISTFF